MTIHSCHSFLLIYLFCKNCHETGSSFFTPQTRVFADSHSKYLNHPNSFLNVPLVSYTSAIV